MRKRGVLDCVTSLDIKYKDRQKPILATCVLFFFFFFFLFVFFDNDHISVHLLFELFLNKSFG